MREHFSAVIGANINRFQRSMRQVDRIVKRTAMETEKPITANIRRFQAQIKKLQAITASAMRRSEKTIGADISEFMRKAALVQAATKALNRRVVIKVDTNIKEFQRVLNKIATTIRSIDTVILSGLGGTLMANIPMLAPIISGLTGAIAMLGNMLGVLIGSTFAYASALFFAGTAAVGFAAVAIPSIAGVFGETEEMTKAQKAARKEFDKFSKTYQGIVKELEKPVLQAFNKAMQIGTRILEMARPTFDAAATAVNNLMDSFNRSLDSEPVKAFFDYMNKSAGPLLQEVFTGVGYLLQGLLNMFVAFGPLAESTAKGFTEMNKRFAEWAANLGESAGFQKFVGYVERNMPKVRAIFRDMFNGIIYTFAAFAPHSEKMMQGFANMMARFKEWARTLGENQQFQSFLDYISKTGPGVLNLIGNLTKFLVNLGIGMAPLGAVLLNMMNGFLQWSNSMMKTYPIIGQIFAAVLTLIGTLVAVVPSLVALKYLFGGLGTAIVTVLRAALTPLWNLLLKLLSPLRLLLTSVGALVSYFGGPFIAVVAAVIAIVTALVAVFIRMWQENEALRNGVMTAWTAIKDTVMLVVMAISEFVMSIFGQLVAWWQENNQLIKDTAQTIWNATYLVISTAIYLVWDILVAVWSLIAPFVTYTWNMVLAIVQFAWDLIKKTVQAAINFVLDIIKLVMQVITGDWEGAWNTIINILETVWDYIVGLVTAAVNLLSNVLSAGWELTKTLTSAAWNFIASWVQKKVDELPVAVNNALTLVVRWVANKWEEAKEETSKKINLMLTLAGEILGRLVDKVEEKMQEALDWVAEKTGLMPEKVKEFVSDMVSAGADLINGLIEGAVGMASDAIETVKTIAGDMVDAALSFFKIKSPSRVFREMGQYLSEGLAVGVDRKAKSAIQSVTNVASSMTRAFQPQLAMADMQASMGFEIKASDMKAMKHELELSINHLGNESTARQGNTTTNNYRGMMEGATFVVREEADIDKIADALFRKEQLEKRRTIR